MSDNDRARVTTVQAPSTINMICWNVRLPAMGATMALFPSTGHVGAESEIEEKMPMFKLDKEMEKAGETNRIFLTEFFYLLE
jgi:hypothetical protein